jgi:hypothetical protein
MNITPEILKAVRVDINDALVAISAKYAITLHAGNATYTENHMTMKIDGVRVGGLSKDAERYNGAAFLKLPPLGTEFKHKSAMFKTTGLNSTGSKVLCDRADGQHFAFPVDSLLALCKVA